MNARLGLVGVFLFAIGGFFLYFELFELFRRQTVSSSGPFLWFLSFLLFGFGLWSIISSGRIEMKQEH
ncbi:MAG TPA: hypothetical protein VK209_04030 [Candidatus Sulfotelmatobacter sp.]|jgi:uncharacterized membrane protein|nr:hypothetical protein [Candidatus Sulfotelmatobacter sp.]